MKAVTMWAALPLTFLFAGAASGVELRAAVSDAEAWHQRIEHSLSLSDLPREQAIAALPLSISQQRSDRESALAAAAQAAPRDVFVQWLAATTLTGPGLVPDRERARKLAALDPDNASHWSLVLRTQAANDTAAIDETLSRMAGASRFDEHFRDELLGWADAYERSSQPGKPPYAELYTGVMLRVSTSLLPTYDAIHRACNRDGLDAAVARARRASCMRIAGLMVSGNLTGTQLIGDAIRRMQSESPADAPADLDAIWVLRKSVETTSGRLLDPTFDEDDMYRRNIDSWRGLDNEREILRRGIVEAGISPRPPPGWKPVRQPAPAEKAPGL